MEDWGGEAYFIGIFLKASTWTALSALSSLPYSINPRATPASRGGLEMSCPSEWPSIRMKEEYGYLEHSEDSAGKS